MKNQISGSSSSSSSSGQGRPASLIGAAIGGTVLGDLDGIRSDLRDIKGELKNMRGWKQFLLTGGIGVGWGVVQGIFHLFGVGSAP